MEDKARLERLILLNEECAEVQQAISKIIRHGMNSSNPLIVGGTTNWNHLLKEIGHLGVAINLLIKDEPQSKDASLIIEASFDEKVGTIDKWLHYNKFKEDETT